MTVTSGRDPQGHSSCGREAYGKLGTEPTPSWAIDSSLATAARQAGRTPACALPQLRALRRNIHTLWVLLGSSDKSALTIYPAQPWLLCALGKWPPASVAVYETRERSARLPRGGTRRSISTCSLGQEVTGSRSRTPDSYGAERLLAARFSFGGALCNGPSNTCGVCGYRAGKCRTLRNGAEGKGRGSCQLL